MMDAENLGARSGLLRERGDSEHAVAELARWRGLFEKLREGFVVAELVRGSDGRVVDWRYIEVNEAWSRLVGLPSARQLLIGSTVTSMVGFGLNSFMAFLLVRKFEFSLAQAGLFAGLLASLPVSQLTGLIKAFTHYFGLINLAESVERLRVLRERDRQNSDKPRSESIGAALRLLKAEGVEAGPLRQMLAAAQITPVFTAIRPRPSGAPPSRSAIASPPPPTI